MHMRIRLDLNGDRGPPEGEGGTCSLVPLKKFAFSLVP